MKRILLFLFFVFLSFVSNGQCAVSTLRTGEELKYDCFYNLGFIWVKAGIADININVDDEDYNIISTCTSARGWDWFFKLRDTMSVSGNSKTLLPNHFRRIVNESSYHANFDYKFDYDSACIISNGFKKKDIFVNKKIKLDTPAIDVITFSWFVRGIDFDKYKKNDKIPVRMIISNDIYNIYIRYKGIETIKIKTGEEILCYKFAPLLIKGTTFSGGESMYLWVSKDDNRVPIMMEAEVVVGSVKAILSSYKNIRYKSKIFPFTSGCMGDNK
jgi:hypothetical protein